MIILNSAVAYLALGATLLLGLYLVTRSPRRATAWLAAGTLWALSGYFLNRLINLNVTTYGGIASLGAMSAIWAAPRAQSAVGRAKPWCRPSQRRASPAL